MHPMVYWRQLIFLFCYESSITAINPQLNTFMKVSNVILYLQIAQQMYQFLHGNYKIMFELVLSLSYTIIFIIMINVLDIYKKKHSTKDVDLIKIARSKINIVNQYMRVPDFKSLTFPFKDPEENIKITQMRDKIVKKIKEEKTLEASSNKENMAISTQTSQSRFSTVKIEDPLIKNSSLENKIKKSSDEDNATDVEEDNFISHEIKGTFFRLKVNKYGKQKIMEKYDESYLMNADEIYKVIFELTKEKLDTGLYSFFHFFGLMLINVMPAYHSLNNFNNLPTFQFLLKFLMQSIQRFFFSYIFLTMLYITGVEMKKNELSSWLFNCLTSYVLARKLRLFYFKLNTLNNIKIRVTLRSMLRQKLFRKLIDGCVTISLIFLLSFTIILGHRVLNRQDSSYSLIYSMFINEYCLELICWTAILGCFVMQYTSDVNQLANNFSTAKLTLISEELNLNLSQQQMSVDTNGYTAKDYINLLKTVNGLVSASDLPFTITGISPNPLICNAIRLIAVTIVSAIFSEVFGHKMNLTK